MAEDENSKNFNFCIPLDFSKASNGDWRIKGLASTEHLDLQGEIVRQNSLDITPLKEGRGLLNWDHKDGPENILGAVDGAELTEKGLEVEGYLYKNSERAKSVYNLLSSFKDKDKRRLQMSIEGKILRRAGPNGRDIAAARIDKVALTFDPVNPNTYAQLVKSLSSDAVVDEEVKKEIEELSGIQVEAPIDFLDALSLNEAREVVNEVVAKAKKIIEQQQAKGDSEKECGINGINFSEIKKAIKEKIENFYKANNSIVELGYGIIKLWDQTGMFGNLYDQEPVYTQFKEAVTSGNTEMIKSKLPQVMQIWRDEGLGTNENESQELYSEALRIVGEVRKALEAGNYNVPPDQLKDGTALEKESLITTNKKRKKKHATKTNE